MKRRILDLFCCAGGAGMGYHQAGFDVTGVDINPQPRYPFTFHRGDALEFLAEHAHKYDAIHASPPCQAHTTMSNRHRGKGTLADSRVDLIGPTRDLIASTGLPYVLENVPGARLLLRSPVTLHGGMFGLGVHRPRLFEMNVAVMVMAGPVVAEPLGVYGKAHDGRRLWTRADGSIQRAAGSLEEARAAMGIDWMQWRELAEAIPPAYTRFLGEQLLAHVEGVAA